MRVGSPPGQKTQAPGKHRWLVSYMCFYFLCVMMLDIFLAGETLPVLGGAGQSLTQQSTNQNPGSQQCPQAAYQEAVFFCLTHTRTRYRQPQPIPPELFRLFTRAAFPEEP